VLVLKFVQFNFQEVETLSEPLHLTSPHLAKLPKLSQLTTGPQSQQRQSPRRVQSSVGPEVKSSQLTECQFSSVHFLNHSPPYNQLVCVHLCTLASQCYTGS
jgi:hypothetical protein